MKGIGRLQIAAILAALTVAHLARASFTVRDMMQLWNIGGALGDGLSLSPDGRWVAFEMHRADIERDTYDIGWYIAPVDGSRAFRRLSDAGDAELFRGELDGSFVVPAAKWSSDSVWIAYLKRDAGGTQIWRVRAAGGPEEQLTHSDADVLDFEWFENGTRVIYQADRPRAHLRREQSDAARRGYLLGESPAWSYSRYPIGPKTVTRESEISGGRTARANKLEVIETATFTVRPASSEEHAHWEILRGTYPGNAGADARVVWHQGTRRGARLEPVDPHKPYGIARVAVSDPARPTWNPQCASSVCIGRIKQGGFADSSDTLRAPPAAIGWSQNGRAVYFIRMLEMGRGVLFEWSLATGKVRRVAGGAELLSACSASAQRLVCIEKPLDRPRTVVAIDLRSSTIETLVDPNSAYQRGPRPTAEILSWTFSDGRLGFGTLVKPTRYEHGRVYPLVVAGYRSKSAFDGGTGAELPVFPLADAGFLVLVYDYIDPTELFDRRIGENVNGALSYDDFMREAYGPKLLNVRPTVSSIDASLELLAQRGMVDPGKVGIAGFSDGVQIAAYELIHSKKFRAAALSTINWEPESWSFVLDANWAKALSTGGLGRVGSVQDQQYDELSLSRNVDQIDAPILVNAGDEEYLFGLPAFTAFRDAHRALEMYVYPDEQHVKWHPTHRSAVLERNLDWFLFWLQRYEDPEPQKVSQYKRWRALRDRR